MSGIHSRFGPDCLLRSCPAVPCTLGQDKTFNPKVFPGYGEFYQTKMPLIWSSKHSYLNLIFCPPKKAVSQSECEIEGRILSAEVRSV